MKSICIQSLLCVFIFSYSVLLARAEHHGNKTHKTDSTMEKIVKELVNSCKDKSISSKEIRTQFHSCTKGQIQDLMVGSADFKASEFDSTAKKICTAGNKMISCFTSPQSIVQKCLDEKDKVVVGLIDKLCANDAAEIIGLKDGIVCILNDPTVSLACAQKATLGVDLNDEKSVRENICKLLSEIESCTMGAIDLCPNKKEETKIAFKSFWSYLKADEGIREFVKTNGNCTLGA